MSKQIIQTQEQLDDVLQKMGSTGEDIYLGEGTFKIRQLLNGVNIIGVNPRKITFGVKNVKMPFELQIKEGRDV